ncbi:MAG: cysteine synthase family protein [Candidatus Binatia bacterium]
MSIEVTRNFHALPETPLVPVRLNSDDVVIWCKLELLNPSGSTKDRIASFIVAKACRQGRLRPGDCVIEASSGSTSIAFARVCAQTGLRFVAVMPDGVSNERLLSIRAYGGEVITTPPEKGIQGALDKAAEEAERLGAFLPRQFSNPDNPEAHRLQTAQENIRQSPDGRGDAIVSGVGTGGTLVGLYQGLVDHGCQVKPFAAKPTTGSALSDVECCSFSARIPGIVECLSQIYAEADLPNLVELEIEDDKALDVARRLIRLGFPVGPSSGLNYAAAQAAAAQLEEDSRIVTVFPDRMERYFSTELFV